MTTWPTSSKRKTVALFDVQKFVRDVSLGQNVRHVFNRLSLAKLLQKIGIQKNEVIDLIYRIFGKAANYSQRHPPTPNQDRAMLFCQTDDEMSPNGKTRN